MIGGQYGRNIRDEVLCGILFLVMITLTLQVFQYEKEQWSKMDLNLERGRSWHAIAEVNIRSVCFGIGNLNLIKSLLGIIINSHAAPLLKSTWVLVALVISMQLKKKIEFNNLILSSLTF